MKLLLFDLDGTLLLTHGLGRKVVAAVLTGLLGRDVTAHDVSFSGKTDPQIFRDLLTREADAGHDVGDVDAALRAALARYEAAMAERLLAAEITALPGALALVDRLARRDDVLLGVLTGNLEPLAHGKLRAAGFPDVFRVGAFGSDAEDRNALGPVALARASALMGRPFTGADAVVIGDTPRDVECARAVGAAVVVVPTGTYTRTDLEAHGPDLVLDSLEDADALEAFALARAAA